jgi:hypothetical protein
MLNQDTTGSMDIMVEFVADFSLAGIGAFVQNKKRREGFPGTRGA